MHVYTQTFTVFKVDDVFEVGVGEEFQMFEGFRCALDTVSPPRNLEMGRIKTGTD